MIIDQLILQGLSRKEAEVYMVLVRYGSNRAADICRRVKINRTLVYALLESLVRKGFVEKLARNGRVLYTANDPSVFVQSAKSQLERAHYLAEDLHNVQLVKSQPVIRTFQGLDGIKQMTDIFLDEAQQVGGDMLQMGQEIQFVLDHPELIESFIGKRVERGIPLKLLCNRFEGFKLYLNAQRDSVEIREVKLVDTKSFNVDCTTYLYGDSMAVLSLSDEMQGYIMKSKNITDMHRQMFFLLWDRL